MGNGISLDYLAGYIDADGYIGINKSQTANKSYRYTAYLGITSTKRSILQLMQLQYGGGLTRNNVAKGNANAKYSLVWYTKRAQAVLQLIIDRLVLKQDQAQLVIIFPISTPGVNMSKQENVLRQVLYNRCQILNKRGRQQ